MGRVTLKHLTSSVFVFRQHPDGWRIGLIRHPRLHRMMIPGGHVEPEESCAEAALREVAEETGLAVTLVGPPAAPVPPGYRGRRVAPPWWIAEYQVAGDNHLGAAHVHVDHLYVALADDTGHGDGAARGDLVAAADAAAHQFGWYAAADLAGLHMFNDARVLALALLAGLAGGADRAGPAAALVAGLSQA
jgi:8-oxo-dGTP pyrophosphatase MutT (NUDIX family)